MCDVCISVLSFPSLPPPAGLAGAEIKYMESKHALSPTACFQCYNIRASFFPPGFRGAASTSHLSLEVGGTGGRPILESVQRLGGTRRAILQQEAQERG